jgi:site-specific DNA recombinase
MAELEARRLELGALLANAPAPSPVLIHPKMGERYRQEVARLRDVLNEDSRRVEAAEIIRSLVDEIKLTPVAEDGRTTWSLDLSGHLAGILNLARAGKEAAGRQVKLVAGSGFEPLTSRL